ncbi:response regulator receiver domain [Aliivibrio sp. S4TY2]|uniref:response regulator receiver domain n=1 Tax=unclassified Aliivibrio TaxID=2645654 RepID=UPI002378D695|nr:MULTISPECIES: response regulator receiver domain [unclassified Aliivibrio]MDD9155434.1 response regulator receiver domain [Aliivibrio sp. S4TY2]MDD9161561.1 response regulator receiver domain [Aliivibrio sp. S4TY1]MDD9165591.1 response regulator receiver domain [Aliivibrio sp. S4MY2]MDD9169590.1 response regulator receiver domain [Aliivibrio sp. S4MY4]MDD9186583.1 response regulator receiver domain [Aliivibrio sp. S4MY3]
MAEEYNDLIISTFRDKPIKSVLLIDDQFSPYEYVVESIISLQEKLALLTSSIKEQEYELLQDNIDKYIDDINNEVKESHRAKYFSDFFHTKKINCDVENDTDNLEPEKIRKSDLIILDYHLRQDDPSVSLNLLSSLCHSPHMNMVVVYTSEDLHKTWLQVAASLRGVPNLDESEYFSNEEHLETWDSLTEGNEVPVSWEGLLTEEQIATYLLTDEFPNRVRGEIYRARVDRTLNIDSQHLEYFINKKVNEYNNLKSSRVVHQLHGEFISDDCKWLQIGNVFVAFCKKGEDLAEQPSMVWNKLGEALLNWQPNFYRIITSELQNRIEDANLSMPKIMSKELHEQISLLASILVSKPEEQLASSSKVLDYLLQDISNDLLNREGETIAKFIENVALNSLDDPISYVDVEHEGYGLFVKEVMTIATNNIDSGKEKNEELYINVAHAHNEQISTINDLPSYITSGMVLYSEEKNNWYLCVTPSCDTMPNQGSESDKEKWWPHRQITLLNLTNDNCKNALEKATECKHIFVSKENKRYALRIINEITSMPSIEKVIVKNHDNDDMDHTGRDVIFFSTEGDEIKQDIRKLRPVTLLKPAYAARYQNTQSHYEGRIGVDFIPFK